MADYLNGVFMKKKDGKYGEYFVISFKDDGLQNLKSLSQIKMDSELLLHPHERMMLINTQSNLL